MLISILRKYFLPQVIADEIKLLSGSTKLCCLGAGRRGAGVREGDERWIKLLAEEISPTSFYNCSCCVAQLIPH